MTPFPTPFPLPFPLVLLLDRQPAVRAPALRGAPQVELLPGGVDAVGPQELCARRCLEMVLEAAILRRDGEWLGRFTPGAWAVPVGAPDVGAWRAGRAT